MDPTMIEEIQGDRKTDSGSRTTHSCLSICPEMAKVVDWAIHGCCTAMMNQVVDGIAEWLSGITWIHEF
jgi:hypothetical protein